ncbi:MAG: hypothetical protein MJE63_33480 [Proteobacteria bacterium]|nr:hypothetical protein [Pseudomonadota bacterium]
MLVTSKSTAWFSTVVAVSTSLGKKSILKHKFPSILTTLSSRVAFYGLMGS